MRSRLFTGFGVLGLRGLPFEVARRNHLLEHVFGVARPRCATGAKGSDRLTAMAAPPSAGRQCRNGEPEVIASRIAVNRYLETPTFDLEQTAVEERLRLRKSGPRWTPASRQALAPRGRTGSLPPGRPATPQDHPGANAALAVAVAVAGQRREVTIHSTSPLASRSNWLLAL